MPKTRGSAIVISLIIAMLCLSIGAIALIILFNANRPDSAAISAACKSEVGAAIKAESNRVAEACAEKPVINKTVVANSNHPGFVYPENLQVTGTLTVIEGGGTRHLISMYRDAPIAECGECDGGPIAAIRISKDPISLVIKSPLTLATYIQSMYQSENTSYHNVTVTDETLNGQKITVVRGDYDNDFYGEKDVKIEHLFIEKGTSLIQVVYSQYSNTAFAGYIAPSVWQTVRSSLDFSKIE
jgi:hypothetical protein